MGDFSESLFGCTSDWISCVAAFFAGVGSECLVANAYAKASGESCVIPCLVSCLCCCLGAAYYRG